VYNGAGCSTCCRRQFILCYDPNVLLLLLLLLLLVRISILLIIIFILPCSTFVWPFTLRTCYFFNQFFLRNRDDGKTYKLSPRQVACLGKITTRYVLVERMCGKVLRVLWRFKIVAVEYSIIIWRGFFFKFQLTVEYLNTAVFRQCFPILHSHAYT